MFIKNNSKLVSDEYVGRAAVTKAIQMKLDPTEETAKFLDEYSIVESDKKRAESVKTLYPVIDAFIKNAIGKGLSGLDVDWDAYEAALSQTEQLAKNRDEYVKDVYTNLIGEARRKVRDMTRDILSKAQECIIDAFPDDIEELKDLESAKKFKSAVQTFIDSYDGMEIEGVDKVEALKGLEATTMQELKKWLTTRTTVLATLAPTRVLENYDIYRANMGKFQKLQESGLRNELYNDFPQLKDSTTPAGYKACLSPEGIDRYNLCISGISDENGIVVSGFNKAVQELLTAAKNSSEQVVRVGKAKQLAKQILFETEKSFAVEPINDDNEAKILLKNVKDSLPQAFLLVNSLLTNAEEKDIAVNGNDLHSLSHLISGDHASLPNAIKEEIRQQLALEFPDTSKPSVMKKYNKALAEREAAVAQKTYLLSTLTAYLNEGNLYGALRRCLAERVENVMCCERQLFEGPIFKRGYAIYGNAKSVEAVRLYMEAITDVRRVITIFKASEDSIDDTEETLSACIDAFALASSAHKRLHSFVTKKSKSMAKSFPLLFGTPAKASASWWNDDDALLVQKKDFVLLRKDGKYYIATVYGASPKNPHLLPAKDGEECYEALSFKNGQGQGSAKSLPKLTCSNKKARAWFADPDNGDYIITENVSQPFAVTRAMFNYSESKLYGAAYASRSGYRANLAAYLNFLYSFAKVYTEYSQFDLTLPKAIEDYTSVTEFHADLTARLYSKRWVKVSAANVDFICKEGILSLFLVNNDGMYDAERNSRNKGYTKVFFSIFSDENLSGDMISLNAAPSITFRPAIYEEKATHPKGSILVNRYASDGRRIPEELYLEINQYVNSKVPALSKEAEEWLPLAVTHKADFAIHKYRRYEKDAFRLNMSYTVNKYDNLDASVPKREQLQLLNSCVDASISYEPNICALSRGVDELLHMTIIDKDGNLLEDRNLSTINDISYTSLLAAHTAERRESQRDWNSSSKIKDIKDAYISLAITEVVNAALKHNALIVVENISDTYKDKMSLIDNQIYKRFEALLKTRLETLVVHGSEDGDAGSVTRPLQLITSSATKARRDGLYMEISPSYTKSMCPHTGFVSLFDLRDIASAANKRDFFRTFDCIKYVDIPGGNGAFAFDFDYKTVPIKTDKTPKKTKWTVYVRGQLTPFDREKKHYYCVENAAEDLRKAVEASNVDAEENIIPKLEYISAEAVNMLYNYFLLTLKGTVKPVGDKVTHTYWKSPVSLKVVNDETEVSIRAKMLGRKAQFMLGGGDATKWLDYIQSQDEK